MVGGEEESGVVARRHLAIATEQAVEPLKVESGDVAVPLEVLGRHFGLARRHVGREQVTDAVAALQIEDREVGMRLVDEGAEELVVEPGLDQDATQRRDRIVVGPCARLLGLDARGVVGGGEPRQEARELGGVDRCAGAPQRVGCPRLALGRIHGACRAGDPRG